jgi:hypothetical protein
MSYDHSVIVLGLGWLNISDTFFYSFDALNLSGYLLFVCLFVCLFIGRFRTKNSASSPQSGPGVA